MKIGIAGPVTISLLRGFEKRPGLPSGYDNPGLSGLVNALWARGHDLVVYTTSTNLPEPTIERASRLTLCVARREPRAARDLFLSERRDLVDLMRACPTEIINAHWGYEFGWAALEAEMPTLVTLRDHASTILRHMPDPYRLMRWVMNSYVVRRAPYLSTNSEYLYKLLPQRYREKSRVIRNFFPAELSNYYMPYERRTNSIISVANGFRGRKNLKTALRAFHLLRKNYPQLTFQLIGADMGRNEPAERFAVRSGFADGVSFLGRLPHSDVLHHIQKARLMLHSSLEESFGMSVLEALVIGTPVVGGNRSGNIPALLESGKAGILCEITDPQAIADAAGPIVSNEDLGRRFAAAGRAFALSKYSEDIVVNEYVDYYRDILARER